MANGYRRNEDGGHHALRLSCGYLEPQLVREGVRRLSGLIAEAA